MSGVESVDTSVVVAAMVAGEPFHDECDRLLDTGGRAFTRTA
jgi:predicted nucleic acid-binding protein